MNKRNENWAELSPKGRKAFRVFAVTVVAGCMILSMTVPVLADGETGGDPISVVNNLSDFIFGLIRAASFRSAFPFRATIRRSARTDS